MKYSHIAVVSVLLATTVLVLPVSAATPALQIVQTAGGSVFADAGQQNVTLLSFDVTSGADDIFFTNLQLKSQQGDLKNALNYALWADTNGDGVVDSVIQKNIAAVEGKLLMDNFTAGGQLIATGKTMHFEVHADIAATPIVPTLQLAIDTSAFHYAEAQRSKDSSWLQGIQLNSSCASTCDITVQTAEASTLHFASVAGTPANLTLTYISNATYAAPGDTFTYSASITNPASQANVSGVTVTTTLPSGVTILSTQGGSINGQTVTWSNLSLASGKSTSLAVDVKVNSGLAEGAGLGSTVQITGGKSAQASTVVHVPVASSSSSSSSVAASLSSSSSQNSSSASSTPVVASSSLASKASSTPSSSSVPSSSASPDYAKLPPAGYEDTVLANVAAYANPFPDTDMRQLSGRAAAELYRRAVIGGFPDGQFKGTRSVNRAEAAKFLLLARYAAIADVMNTGRFPDVVDGQWYTKFVMTAADKGIINGYPDGLFRPANSVQTDEFLKMLSLAFGLQLNMQYHYTDVPADSWFAQYAGIAEKYTLFPSHTDSLAPEKLLTRQDVAVAIYQYLSHR